MSEARVQQKLAGKGLEFYLHGIHVKKLKPRKAQTLKLQALNTPNPETPSPKPPNTETPEMNPAQYIRNPAPLKPYILSKPQEPNPTDLEPHQPQTRNLGYYPRPVTVSIRGHVKGRH